MIQSQKKMPKLLIVDDDKDLLDVLSDVFSADGNKVITAMDGVGATFKYNNEEFDAIITDIKMPKKDGIKFLQHVQVCEGQKMIRTGSTYRPLPIFLISASVEDYSEELELLSNVEIIPKPFSPKDALARVKHALDRKTSSSSQSASVSFKAGDYVMKEGDPGSDIFFVKAGKLKVTKKNENGVEVQVCTVGPGEIVGEMGFLLKKIRSASVQAMMDSELISIPKEKFDAIIESQPRWFKVLFETIAARLEDTTKAFVNRNSKN